MKRKLSAESDPANLPMFSYSLDQCLGWGLAESCRELNDVIEMSTHFTISDVHLQKMNAV